MSKWAWAAVLVHSHALPGCPWKVYLSCILVRIDQIIVRHPSKPLNFLSWQLWISSISLIWKAELSSSLGSPVISATLLLIWKLTVSISPPLCFFTNISSDWLCPSSLWAEGDKQGCQQWCSVAVVMFLLEWAAAASPPPWWHLAQALDGPVEASSWFNWFSVPWFDVINSLFPSST